MTPTLVEERMTPLSLEEARSVVESWGLDPKVRAMGKMAMFEYGEDDARWAVLTLFGSEQPLVVELRGFAAADDPKLAALRAHLEEAFGGSDETVDLRRRMILVEPGLTFFDTSRELALVLQTRGAIATEGSLDAPDIAFDCEYFVSRHEDSEFARRARAGGGKPILEKDLRDVLGTPLHSYRERLEESLAGARETGIRVRNLGYAPGASEAQFARVEEKLGVPLPAALRSFYSQTDGLSLFMHSSPGGFEDGIADHSVPLEIENRERTSWSTAMDEGGWVWSAIREADHGTLPDGAFFFAGVICIPDLETVFFTDWGSKMGWDEDTFLLDAFHPFHGTVLRVDRDEKDIVAIPSSDHGADLSAAPIQLEVYFESILQSCGADRLVSARYPRTSTDVRRVSVHSNG